MIVGYDAKRLFHNHTGLGYYSRTLVQSLLKFDPSFSCVLFDSNPKVDDLTRYFFDHPRCRINTYPAPKWYYRSINANSYLYRSPVELYHGLSNELPIRKVSKRIPTVVTINDVLYHSFPQDFPAIDRQIYHFKTKNALANADLVICISEATKREVLNLFPTTKTKLLPIHISYDPIFDVLVPPEQVYSVNKKYNLPNEYNLYVGSVTHRKNLKIILEGIQTIAPESRTPLVVVGAGGPYLGQMKKYCQENKINDLVHFLQNIPREDLRTLYEGAQAMIYPSLGEGFGLPVLEAIAANIPVITSNSSSLPEAGGDVASYIDPTDVEQMAQAMLKINKELFRQHHQVKRRAHLQKFSSAYIADQYLRVAYEPLL